MGLGSYTDVYFIGKGKNKAKIMQQIFDYGNEADEGELYARVFGYGDKELTENEEYELMDKAGVTSLCQANCSAEYNDYNNVIFHVYSVFETPVGIWKEISRQFPTVEVLGTVVREDDETIEGDFRFKGGEGFYNTPEQVADEDEDESD